MDLASPGFSALEDTIEMSQTLEEKETLKASYTSPQFGPPLPTLQMGEVEDLAGSSHSQVGGLQPPELL